MATASTWPLGWRRWPTRAALWFHVVVHDQVRDKLSFSFEDMGEQTVKNIARPIGVHRVSLAEHAAPQKPAGGGSSPEQAISAPVANCITATESLSPAARKRLLQQNRLKADTPVGPVPRQLLGESCHGSRELAGQLAAAGRRWVSCSICDAFVHMY